MYNAACSMQQKLISIYYNRCSCYLLLLNLGRSLLVLIYFYNNGCRTVGPVQPATVLASKPCHMYCKASLSIVRLKFCLIIVANRKEVEGWKSESIGGYVTVTSSIQR